MIETTKMHTATNVDSQLDCFKYNNPSLFKVSTKLLSKLRSFFGHYPNLNIQLEKDSFKFIKVNGEQTIVELCLSISLFNLPVFFKVNQNSLILVMTSVQMTSYKPHESWLAYKGNYVRKILVDDPSLDDLLLDTQYLMQYYSHSLMQDVSVIQQEMMVRKIQTLDKSKSDIVLRAPLVATISTILMSDELNLDSLTNLEFMIRLLLNTAIASSMLVGIELLIDKFKNEFKSK